MPSFDSGERLQTIYWWEKAATEVMNQGVDPAQALRFFAKAEAAAETVATHFTSQRLADSAMGLLLGTEHSLFRQPSQGPQKSGRQAFFHYTSCFFPFAS